MAADVAVLVIGGGISGLPGKIAAKRILRTIK